MSNKNFDEDTITNFVDSMKDQQGQSLVKFGPWKRGLNTYKGKNNGGTVSNIETFKNLKKNVLLSTIEAVPDSQIAKKYNEFQFEDTAMLKKEDLLDKLLLRNNQIQDLLDLVDNCCLNTEDFGEAKKVFSDICISDKPNLNAAGLKFASKFKKGSLTWKQIWEIWAIKCEDKEDQGSYSFTFNNIDTLYSALEVINEKEEIDYKVDFLPNIVLSILMSNFYIDNNQVTDFKVMPDEKIQKLGDYLFGFIYMMLIHSKEYLENRKIEALNDFFGDNKKGSFSDSIGYNILEYLGSGFANKLSVVYLNNGYFEKSQNEHVVQLRNMLKENKCELKVENDEKGNQKIVFKNNQEKIVEQPLAIRKYKEDKDINIADKKNNEELTKEENPNGNKNDLVKNRDADKYNEESKTPIWLLVLDKIAYCIWFVFTLGSPIWAPSLTEKLFSAPKISKLDQDKVDKSILPNTSEVKDKDKDINQNIKLGNENGNKNENVK